MYVYMAYTWDDKTQTAVLFLRTDGHTLSTAAVLQLFLATTTAAAAVEAEQQSGGCTGRRVLQQYVSAYFHHGANPNLAKSKSSVATRNDTISLYIRAA